MTICLSFIFLFSNGPICDPINDPIKIISGKYQASPTLSKLENCPDAPAVTRLAIAVGSFNTNDVTAADFKFIPSPTTNRGTYRTPPDKPNVPDIRPMNAPNAGSTTGFNFCILILSFKLIKPTTNIITPTYKKWKYGAISVVFNNGAIKYSAITVKGSVPISMNPALFQSGFILSLKYLIAPKIDRSTIDE